MHKNTKTSLIYISIGIVLIASSYVSRTISRNNMNSKIKNNPEYTIGVLKDVIEGGTPRGRRYTIVYVDFKTQDTCFNNVECRQLGLNVERIEKGNKYLLVYDFLNPENCVLLFNYPIKDSLDFYKYTGMIKEDIINLDDLI